MHATHDPKHDHEHTHAQGHDHSHTHEHVCWGHSTHSPVHHRLEISNLKVSYREVLALEGINFATECGRSLALVGPNGAGKSTLLKSLAGLLKLTRAASSGAAALS